jgi:hypothetical protein
VHVQVNSFKYAVRPERRRQHALELRGATGAAIEMLTRQVTGRCLSLGLLKMPVSQLTALGRASWHRSLESEA